MIDPKDTLHIERCFKEFENTYSVIYVLKNKDEYLDATKYHVAKEDMFGNPVDIKEVDERAKQCFMSKVEIIDVKHDNSIESPFNK